MIVVCGGLGRKTPDGGRLLNTIEQNTLRKRSLGQLREKPLDHIQPEERRGRGLVCSRISSRGLHNGISGGLALSAALRSALRFIPLYPDADREHSDSFL